MKKWLSCFLIFNSFLLSFAQTRDSLPADNRHFNFEYKKLYVPTSLMVSGLILNANRKSSLHPVVIDKKKDLFGFTNNVDDYTQFVPTLAVYGFELARMTPRTDWQNRTAILLKSQALNLGMVYLLKKTVKSPRPDGTAYSFPSGHTANAFAGATMLSIEYGENHKWVPYASYGLATGIGVMRMANNKHYLSDVLFGAGLGILSTKIAYWTHQYRWNRPKNEQDPLTILYLNTLN